MPFSLTVGVPTWWALCETFGLCTICLLPLPRGRGPLIDSLVWRTQRLPLYRLLRLLIGLNWPIIASLTLLEFAT